MLHVKLRNRTCQGLDRQGQGQGQGLTSLPIKARMTCSRLIYRSGSRRSGRRSGSRCSCGSGRRGSSNSSSRRGSCRRLIYYEFVHKVHIKKRKRKMKNKNAFKIKTTQTHWIQLSSAQ